MKALKNLDTRQRALAKLLLDPASGEGAKLEVILQESNFGGLSEAARQASTIARDNLRKPAVMILDVAYGAWLSLIHLGRELGVKGNGYAGRLDRIIEAHSPRGAVTLVFDHIDNLPPDRLSKFFHTADAIARRLGIAVRVVFVVTKIHVYDRDTRSKVARFPGANEILKPRHRTWEFGPHGFKFVKACEEVRLLDEAAPLLDGAEEPEHAFKIA